MGKPEEDAVEFSKDLWAEIVGASGEQAHPRFEFLDRLFADGNSPFGDVKAEEVEPFDKGNNLRLEWRKGKAQLGAQDSVHENQSLFSLGVITAQDHEIVGITHKAEAGLCQTLVKQVKGDIRQQRRNDPALRSAGHGGAKFQPFQHASREKLTDEAQDVAISDALGDAIEDEVMGEVVEESLDVGVYHPFEAVGVSRVERLNRLMRIVARTEAKGELREMRLKDGFEKRTNHFLSNPISDGGNTQSTLPVLPNLLRDL